MKAAIDVKMTAENHGRSAYRADVHPVLVSYFAQEGLTDTEISSRLRISRRTLYTWRRGHPELETALRDSKELADALVEHSLFQKALSGDVSACIFYLCNRSPTRWKRNGQVDVEIRPVPAKDEMSLDEILRTYSEALQQTTQGGPACTP
ncbi:MAG: helix-turn-helix domain-containing protein [Candidatus Cryosericum sp.]